LSKDDDFQARDPPKTAAVARRDPITYGYGGGPDQEVMSPNGHPLRRETRPERSMDARGHEVEREDRKRLQEPLDEGLPTMPLCTSCRSMHPMQEFGGGDRGDADRLVWMRDQGGIELKSSPFGRDQDRRVDQRAHGDRGTRP